MKKKYAVWPREVVSKYDGDVHYISFLKLCRLYGVNPSECLDMTKEEDLRYKGVCHYALTHLRVRKDGKYDSNNRHENTTN